LTGHRVWLACRTSWHQNVPGTGDKVADRYPWARSICGWSSAALELASFRLIEDEEFLAVHVSTLSLHTAGTPGPKVGGWCGPVVISAATGSLLVEDGGRLLK
jgi:hypothetical protein